jgi:small conductance mechanosensitive channel
VIVSTGRIVSAVVVVTVELALLAAVTAALSSLASWAMARAAALRPEPHERTRARQSRVRIVFGILSVAIAIGILAYNGWLTFRGTDVKDQLLAFLASIGPGFWTAAAAALAKLVAAALGIFIGSRILRFALNRIQQRLSHFDFGRDNARSVEDVLRGIYRAVVISGWMLLVVLAFQLLAAPEVIVTGLLKALGAYVVVAIGLLLVRASVAIVDTVEGLSRRYSETRGWTHYHEHLRTLAPTFRACLEYALWIVVAALVLVELGAGRLAVWAPALIQAIGIFFIGCIVVELGRVEIGRRLLPAEGLDDMARRRRETIAPLVRTTFSYAVYFAAAVLVLATLGFNPMPFLAGAGILGLVVGFGAQSLINDVVSGFFILFENTYLVGDSIEIRGAKGVVEEIEFRTTKIRDFDGRVHIFRNGDVKEVVNYSKGYTFAVVPVDVSYDADLRAVCSVLQDAAARVRAESRNVLGEMEIDGIVAFGASALTVRTTTRVKPGRHEAAAAELRLAIKESFDRCADGSERRGLVPARFAARAEPAQRDRPDRIAEGAERSVGPFSITRSRP